MRTFLALLLSASSLFAQADYSTLLLLSPVAAGNSVDWSKGFETGALESGLTETDASSKLDYAATGQSHTGAQSMSVTLDADTIDAYVRKDLGGTRDAASFTLWHYASPASTGDTTLQMITIAASTPGTQNLRVYYSKASGIYGYRIRGADFPAQQAIPSTNAWYRLELNYVRNATSTLRIYNSGGTQIGTDLTSTANNNVCGYVFVGISSSGTARFDAMYFDDLGVDYTDSTFPLWPYTVND